MNYELKRRLLIAAGALTTVYVTRKAIRRWRAVHLRNRVVLISGGARGLGLVLARQFARQHAIVIICARDEAELARAVEDLQHHDAAVASYVCDVRDPAAVAKMVAEITRRYGAVDILINNAGIVQVGPLGEMEREDFEDAIQTHLYGPMNLIDAVLPAMRQRRWGRIVNIASVGGRVAVPHLTPYSTSKFALVGYSQGLRAELAGSGIKVTTVCPGLMRTGSPRNALFKGQHRKEYAWFSISDSLPLLSIDATRAAAKIIDACRQGQADLVIGVPAQIAARTAALMPGLVANAMGLVNRWLPAIGGIGRQRRRGVHSQSRLSPSKLTILSARAAARNNQIGRY